MIRGRRRDMLKEKMMEEAYAKHLEAVKHATKRVDARLSNIKADRLIKLRRVKADANLFLSQFHKNFRLGQTINGILRTTGFVKSFAKAPEYGARSRIPGMQARVRQINRDNQQLGLRILEAKPRVSCWRFKPKEPVKKKGQKLRAKKRPKELPNERAKEHPKQRPKERPNERPKQRQQERPKECQKKEQRKDRLKKKPSFKLPSGILKKYGTSIQVPKSRSLQRKLFRPVIFLDIEVKQLRSPGRVVIELFTEACPEAVLQLVRICVLNETKRLLFPRVFPDLWLACIMLLDDKTMRTNNIEYDMRALDNGSQGGILSLPKEFLQGCKDGRLDFSISFRPLYVLTDRRLAFGRVLRGLEIVRSLEEFGSKNGVLSRKIYVSNIGLVY